MTTRWPVLLVVAAFAVGVVVSTAVRGGEDPAGERAPAPLRFEADDRRLKDCRDDDFRCFRQAFGNLSFRDGPAAALQVLQRMHSSNENEMVTGNCHTLSHEIGRAAYARAPRDAARTLSVGTMLCGGGYQHGVLESVFAEVPVAELGATARRFCAEVAAEGAEDFCKHGVGHGSMYFTNFDLPKALAICDEVQTARERDACGTGVFMENLTSLPRIRNAWLDAGDLAHPCPVVPERHRWACYRQMASRTTQAGKAWPETAQVCASAARRYQPSCVGSMGLIATTSQNPPAELLRICTLAHDFVSICLADAAAELQNMYEPDQSRRLELCRLARRKQGSSDTAASRGTRAFAGSEYCDPAHRGLYPPKVIYG